MDKTLPFSNIIKINNKQYKKPEIVLSLVNINNTIDNTKWENIKKIFAWKIGEENKLFVKLMHNNKILNAKNKEGTIKINFTERYINTNDVENILFINNIKSIKGIYYHIKLLSNNDFTKENHSKLIDLINNINNLEKVTFILNKNIVEKFGCQKNYKYLMPPGKPTKLAPIPKPAPDLEEAPMLGK